MTVVLVRVIKTLRSSGYYDDNNLHQLWKKMTSLPKNVTDCFGKCRLKLTIEEIDTITDHIHKTLTHPKGRRFFRDFLSQSQRMDDLACLNFYERLSKVIDDDKIYCFSTPVPTLVTLTKNANEALDIAGDLDGVPEIDMALLERFTRCLEDPCRAGLIDVLTDTKTRLMDHLRNAHKDFIVYLLQPCPKTRK